MHVGRQSSEWIEEVPLKAERETEAKAQSEGEHSEVWLSYGIWNTLTL